MKNDIEVLKQIEAGEIKVKSFKYNETKHKSSDAATLILSVQENLNLMAEAIAKNNQAIFNYYQAVASSKRGVENRYVAQYKLYLQAHEEHIYNAKIVSDLIDATAFMNEVTPLETINIKMSKVLQFEISFKENLKKIIDASQSDDAIKQTDRDLVTSYLQNDHIYFADEKYNDEALSILWGAANTYSILNHNSLFKAKKDFLELQASLTNRQPENVQVQVNV